MASEASEYKLHAFATQDEMDLFMKDIGKQISQSAEEFKRHVGLTKLEVGMENGHPVWRIVRRELRPGGVTPTRNSITSIPLEETYRLESLLPEFRAKHLPPVEQNLDLSLQYPQTDVTHLYDYLVIAPRAYHILDDMQQSDQAALELDMLEEDVNMTTNRPTESLALSSKDGILTTESEKRDLMDFERDLRSNIKTAIQDTFGIRMPNIGVDDPVTTDQLFNTYRVGVMNTGKESSLAKEHGVNLSRLEKMQERVEQRRIETEEVSKQAFVDTIETEGMTLPSNVQGASDAVDRLGIGSLEFLRLQ